MKKTDKLCQLMYQNDFASFFQFAFNALYPNQDFYPGYYLKEIAQQLQCCIEGDLRRLAINMPPRHLKTFISSIAYTAWLLGKYPDRRIMIIVGNIALRNEIHTALVNLMSHPRYRSVFPHVKISVGARDIRIKNMGGAVELYLVNQSMVGQGADVIIIDDPVSPTQASDPKNLTRVNNWYDDNVYQRLNNKSKGVVIVVMQRLNENDLVGHLQSQGHWTTLQYPLIAEEDEYLKGKLVRSKGDALCSSLGTPETYHKAMLNMGAKTFMAQYQQKPYPDGTDEIRRGIWSNLRVGVPWKVGDPASFWAFANIRETKILEHTVFGIGEHPWPDDMRQCPCEAEWILQHESDERRYDLIQLMTPEQRIAHGIDPSGKVFPDFTPYLIESDLKKKEKSITHNPNFRPNNGKLFKPHMYSILDEEEGTMEEVYGYEEPLDPRYFDYSYSSSRLVLK